MPVELDELKANHERMKAHHKAYQKRNKVTMALVYLSLAALVLVWLFYPATSSAEPACSSTLCVVSPLLAMILAALCVVFFGLAAKHKARGINAYRRAMQSLDRLRR